MRAHVEKVYVLGWNKSLCVSLLLVPQINWNTQGTVSTRKMVSVISRKTIWVAKAQQSPSNNQAGIYVYNYMYTCVDTCCAGANCKLVLLSNEVCEVSPFLDSYKPVNKILVTRVSAVWMDPNMSREYLIVGDHFLWFGTIVNHSLINSNQLRALNITVHDNTFYATVFGSEEDEAFTPFTSMGAVIIFELRFPTVWEEQNFPVIFYYRGPMGSYECGYWE